MEMKMEMEMEMEMEINQHISCILFIILLCESSLYMGWSQWVATSFPDKQTWGHATTFCRWQLYDQHVLVLHKAFGI